MRYLLFLLCLISLSASAQWSQPNNIYGTKSRGYWGTERFVPAIDTTDKTANNIAGINGKLYVSNGTYFLPITGASFLQPGNRVFFVEDSLNAQPASPEDSTFWLTGGAPTGASGIWTANANKVLFFAGGVYTVPTQSVSDYAVTTDTVYYHQYNGTTWPRTSPIAWNVGGNPSGGILGSTDASKVRIWYNGNTKMLFDGAGVITPPFTGALPGVLGLAANGRWSNVQPGYGVKIGSTIAVDTFKIPTRNTIDSVGALIAPASFPSGEIVFGTGTGTTSSSNLKYSSSTFTANSSYQIGSGDYKIREVFGEIFLGDASGTSSTVVIDNGGATMAIDNSNHASKFGINTFSPGVAFDMAGLARYRSYGTGTNTGIGATVPVFTSNGSFIEYTPSDFKTFIGADGGGSATNAGSGFRILKPATQELKTLFGIKEISIDSSSNTNGLSIGFTPALGGVSTDSMLVYNTTDGARVVSVVDYARFILANPISKQHRFANIDRLISDTIETYSTDSVSRFFHNPTTGWFQWDLGGRSNLGNAANLRMGNNQNGGYYDTLELNFKNVLLTHADIFEVNGLTALAGASIINDGLYFGRRGGGTWYNNPLGINAAFIMGGGSAPGGVPVQPVTDTEGDDILISGGTVGTLASDRRGGDLYLSSGVSAGNLGGTIKFYTTTPGASGTTKNVATLKAFISESGDIRYIGKPTLTDTSLVYKRYVDSLAFGGGGSQDLQTTLNNGYFVDNKNHIDDTVIAIHGTTGQTLVSIYMADDNSPVLRLSDGTNYTDVGYGGIQTPALSIGNSTNAASISANYVTGGKNIELPNADGSLALSVNGTGAGTNGDIDIGTTVGQSFLNLTNPSAIRFPRINADNTVTALDASNFLAAIGGGTGTLTALTGDISASGTGSVAATLATVNSNVGTFGSATQSGTFTVNAKGLITAASNVTITPAIGSVTGLGTGAATALAANVGSAGAFVTFNGAGGTPSSLTGTNITGTATGFTVGNAAKWTTARSIYGNNVDGSANVTAAIAGTYGGTGVNNGSSTITVSGNTTIGSSANTVAIATTGNTSITLPTSGTLATVPNSGSGTYSLTPSWSGTAPTGITATYSWIQDPTTKFTTLTITALYSSAGVTNTQLTAVFPPGAPLPVTPSGVTGAINDKIAAGYGFVDTGPNGFSPAVRVQVMKATTGSSATTDYMIGSSFGSQSSKYFCIAVTYTGQ